MDTTREPIKTCDGWVKLMQVDTETCALPAPNRAARATMPALALTPHESRKDTETQNGNGHNRNPNRRTA